MRPASPDHSTRIVIALGALATARTDENGKPCPTEAAPVRGLSPLTFCSPALDRAVAGDAVPEVRSFRFPTSHTACTSGCVTVHRSNGTTYQRRARRH